mmetsp:Transcript_22532/g.57462  ORF Transcript_22532/g.57462 Transcript_22532/m.57462 type:complete len:227 (-) Transcript_22532:421-1101(-)
MCACRHEQPRRNSPPHSRSPPNCLPTQCSQGDLHQESVGGDAEHACAAGTLPHTAPGHSRHWLSMSPRQECPDDPLTGPHAASTMSTDGSGLPQHTSPQMSMRWPSCWPTAASVGARDRGLGDEWPMFLCAYGPPLHIGLAHSERGRGRWQRSEYSGARAQAPHIVCAKSLRKSAQPRCTHLGHLGLWPDTLQTSRCEDAPRPGHDAGCQESHDESAPPRDACPQH